MADEYLHWNKVYKERIALPWDTDRLPKEINEWVDTSPGIRVLDIGCGRGQHTIRIAERGHFTVGIDISPVAINQAKSSSANRNLDVQFLCTDVINYDTTEPFDLVVDYSVFHHIAIPDRQKYVHNIKSNIKQNGIFLLVCYLDHDPIVRGKRTRVGSMGNIISHPSKKEITEIFGDDFQLISYCETTLGNDVMHPAHHFVYRKS